MYRDPFTGEVQDANGNWHDDELSAEEFNMSLGEYIYESANEK